MVTCIDVAVAGGGPAGAFTARELARAGLSVLMIDPATWRPRLEGLGERVAQLLIAKGLDEALAAASAPLPRHVTWAGLNSTANGERLVRRHVFDEALRRAALEAGAQTRQARLGRILKSEENEGVLLKLSTGEEVRARLLIDARGRQAGSAQRLKGPQTLAIAGLAQEPAGVAGTHVEATPEGWLWVAEDPDFGRWLQISIGADDLSGSGQVALQGRMSRFLAQEQLAGRFSDLSFQDPLIARAAGLVLSAPRLQLPVIPVGDAAVAIDPLSGHGLFWALSSALSAVPSVLTILENPEKGPQLAARFYRDRVVETFWRQARTGRDFYRLETRLSGNSFWGERVCWPDDAPSHPDVSEIHLQQRVVVDSNRLVEREVLVTPQDPGGVAYVAGIPVGDLKPFFPSSARAQPPPCTPSPALKAAFGWLESRGLLHGSLSRTQQHQTKTRETA
ncbi:pilus assembly protein CpaE [Stappia sp. BW2]|uniref:flavin-dependent monooxygenase QhpG n=1 Tax=Stappia sp. BW2 TaxID=2592622 RepID=UPI0011DEC8A6|nr:lycopene cyclase family protein [Stappia sp. BW2]TYC65118.1 pilus assembly protein CpaE [Stappia sp. BW2]